MYKILLIPLLVAAVSCSSGPSREEIRKIKLLEKKDLEKCQPIDAVSGENDKGSEPLAIEEAKMNALKLDADSIFIEDSVANGSNIVIKAMAYSCKK